MDVVMLHFEAITRVRQNKGCCCKSRVPAGDTEIPQRYGLLIMTDTRNHKEDGDWKDSKL